jgi:hypothetical protein
MCEPTTLRCDRVLAYTVLAVRSEVFARRLRGDDGVQRTQPRDADPQP